MRVISADSHVVEPATLWTERMAGGRFADRAPRVVADPSTGAQVFLIDGLPPQPVSLPGAAGQASEALREMGSFDEARAGGGTCRPDSRTRTSTASTPRSCTRRSPWP